MLRSCTASRTFKYLSKLHVLQEAAHMSGSQTSELSIYTQLLVELLKAELTETLTPPSLRAERPRSLHT